MKRKNETQLVGKSPASHNHHHCLHPPVNLMSTSIIVSNQLPHFQWRLRPTPRRRRLTSLSRLHHRLALKSVVLWAVIVIVDLYWNPNVVWNPNYRHLYSKAYRYEVVVIYLCDGGDYDSSRCTSEKMKGYNNYPGFVFDTSYGDDDLGLRRKSSSFSIWGSSICFSFSV